ncbi:MAG: hypothetical protein GY930_13650 [bacterium]|nr:hypothetical protein [Actinomycetes bacterium]MCP5022804.1 hypothetical protein [bacterium]
MRGKRVIGGLLLAVMVASCGFSQGPEVDRALSEQLRPQFAQCLELPIGAVELEVDEHRRAIRTGWVDDVGDGPERSTEACLELLNIDHFED